MPGITIVGSSLQRITVVRFIDLYLRDPKDSLRIDAGWDHRYNRYVSTLDFDNDDRSKTSVTLRRKHRVSQAQQATHLNERECFLSVHVRYPTRGRWKIFAYVLKLRTSGVKNFWRVLTGLLATSLRFREPRRMGPSQLDLARIANSESDFYE